MTSRLLVLLALVGCADDKTTTPTETGETGLVGSIDEDGDGFTADEDCDDHDPRTNPAKEEICDGIDNDCDEEVDEDVELTWYADDDGDGFGDLGSTTEACERPDGYVPTATDCDDTSDQSWPGAPELCDGQDNDCDDVADDGATSTYYADADGDGYGDADATTEACEAPDGYVDDDSDCDDADGSSHPDGAESCDGADNDCDGDIDEGTGVEVSWYQDRDEDGYGDPDRVTSACAAPDGYVADNTDCDDLETDTHPGADEICDEADNDCDGSEDEGATDGDTWFADADGDGFGDPTDSTIACDEPAGYSASDEDCDDTDAGINPDAEEICDGVDQDCDGTADDGASDALDWYTDADGDGFGDPAASTAACDAPAGTVANDDDCDDTDDDNYPDAPEICDTEDNDCDGDIDEDGTDNAATWYEDRDEDGYGDPSRTEVSCEPPTGYVEEDTDCDDLDAGIHPGAEETCDGEDDDCDGAVDDDATDAVDWYADADGDAHGDASASASACEAPDGYVGLDDDCDDDDASVHPGATETCDGVDEDCDGDTDEGASDADTWYTDADADGYGDPTDSTEACEAPAGTVANDDDCDDDDATVSPAADEICDGRDDDCDGAVDEDSAVDADTWYADRDEDGHGDPTRTDTACDAPAGYVADGDDCDDLDDTVYPGATETCDGEDEDCDGSTDEDATDATTWYADADGDRFGDAGVTEESCSAPSGYVAIDTDCDDTDSGTHPGATETCDGEDDDCDGDTDEGASDATTWYADGDGDSYGDPAVSDVSCAAPSGYVASDEDCDDGDPAVNPDADERCNTIDDDCDGATDEDSAVDVSTWYQDRDEDSYGDPARTDIDCDQPSGYVSDDSDCDDLDNTVHPGAVESCNGDDDDCDGTTDEDDAVDAATWYADVDNDRYGDPSVSELSCDAPAGYVSIDTDCDDTDSGVNPGATETCDGEDDDCDGAVDEDSASDAGTWYADDDGDSYGDPAVSDVSCTVPSGYVSSSADCDDADASVYPGATEICDGEDDDCDGETDEDSAVDVVTWHQDRDEDGYGDATRTDIDCDQPAGYVEDSTDCDDLVAAVNPGASETCNSVDDDCDGTVDDNATDASTWYADTDSDSYGDASVSTAACASPTGYVSRNGDCDDDDSTAYPGATEVCDKADDDCDGVIDDNASDASDWYPDEDGDGYGDATASPTTDCSGPAGTVADDRDCDDTDSTVHPGATEYCDGTDDDCSGDEDGVVTFTRTTGSKTDYTSTFAAGTATSPASVSITSSGRLTFCDGTYYTNLSMTGASANVESLNGSGSTTLDGGDKGRTFYTTSSSVSLTGLTVQNGYTTANGANVYLYTSSSASLDDVVLLDGAALRGANLGCYQCTADLVDVDIEGGAATSQGGGIYNYQGTITADNVLIDDNTAPNGAAYYGGTGSLELVDSIVSNNAATTYAGALYLNNGSASLDSTDLEYNDGGNYGGGVYMNAATLTMSSSEIANNTADLLGGGVYMNGASSLTCTGASGETAGLWGNMALAAGAVFIGSSSGTLTSNTCDWTASSDNSLYDIVTHLYLYFNYGNNVSFTCASGVCY